VNRVTAVFGRLREAGRAAFMPFISAGDPSPEATGAILRALQDRGAADLVELGVPFSDPIADGPTIQASYQRALGRGVTPQAILDQVKDLRDGGLDLPICLMVSYSLVYRPGMETFVDRSAACGIDGLIVPDLPADEAGPLEAALSAAAMVYVPLVAPTTTPARRQKVIAHATGFIYCMAVTGITGERDRLPEHLDQYVRGIKAEATAPVCVGFGLSRPEHVKAVAAVADGAIVGSAIIHRIADCADEPPARIAEAVADLCARLSAPLRE